MRRLTASFALLTAVTSVVAACGGKVFVDPPSSGGGGQGGSTSSSTSNNVTSTSVVVSSVGPGPGPGPGPSTVVSSSGGDPCGTGTDCSQCPGFDGCNNCCIEFNNDAYVTLVSTFFDLCMCGPGTPCAMACFVNGAPPPACMDPFDQVSQQCNNCLNDIQQNGDPCVQEAINDCFQNPTCSPVLSCLQEC